MCGIVGYVGAKEAGPILLEGLRRLEYRGYDSAGLTVLSPEGRLCTVKEAGKLAQLERVLGRGYAAGYVRNRSYTLGDPWCTEPCERASALEPCERHRSGSQRDLRERRCTSIQAR